MSLKRIPLEWLAWTGALLLPMCIEPGKAEATSLCLFKYLHFPWCPGCGLGNSLAYLYRGELLLSVKTHLMALPALAILGYRWYQCFPSFLKFTTHES